MLLVLALLVLAHPGFAGPPAAVRCNKAKAEAPFYSGIWKYKRSNCQEAIPFFNEAVKSCPVARPPWTVQVALFGEFSYTPFYYLGNCHYNLKDLKTALRDFSFAGCFDENKRHQDLESLTEKCRNQIEGTDRSQSHPDFKDGLEAKKNQKWEQEAEKMWDALHVWTEDGKPTSTYGRWHDPYLPEFRLAEALYELGCFRQAAAQMNKSLVGKLQGPETEEERRRLAELKPDCEQKIRQGYQDKEICQRWECLIK
jgi:tetratricopeptide (TPR) repeat protein